MWLMLILKTGTCLASIVPLFIKQLHHLLAYLDVIATPEAGEFKQCSGAIW